MNFSLAAVVGSVLDRVSVTATRRLGSAPWSPLPLTVEVMAVDGDFAVAVDEAGDVADAVGCGRPGQVGGGVVAGGVVVDGVGNAEFEAGLEHVGEAPGLGGGVEDPLLQACGGLRSGVGVEGGAAGVAVAFVSYVEGVSVGEPEAEGKARWWHVFASAVGKPARMHMLLGRPWSGGWPDR